MRTTKFVKRYCQRFMKINITLALWWGLGTRGMASRIKLSTSGGMKEATQHSQRSWISSEKIRNLWASARQEVTCCCLGRISCCWNSVSGMSLSHGQDPIYMNSGLTSSDQVPWLNGAITGLVQFASDRMVTKPSAASSLRSGSYIWCITSGLTRTFRPGKTYGMLPGINTAGRNWCTTQSHSFRKWNRESWSRWRPRPCSEAGEVICARTHSRDKYLS